MSNVQRSSRRYRSGDPFLPSSQYFRISLSCLPPVVQFNQQQRKFDLPQGVVISWLHPIIQNFSGESSLDVLPTIHGTRTYLQLEGFLCVNFSISYYLIVRVRTGKKRKYINDSWAGKVPSSITIHHSTGRDVSEVKVDEADGYIFTSSSLGGLRVTDLATGEDLWSLPLVGTHLLLKSGFIE